MCSVGASAPTNAQPTYIHNPYLDGGAYGNSVDANRIGTSALTIGLDPAAAKGVVGTGLPIIPSVPQKTTTPNNNITAPATSSTTQPVSGGSPVKPNPQLQL